MNSMNEWADFWRYEIGVNALPANGQTKSPTVKWKRYQNSSISEEQHQIWKKQNSFADGISILPGKVWHRKDRENLYLVHLDADKKTAIEELCRTLPIIGNNNGDTRTTSLEKIAKEYLVEQHDDEPGSAHFYFYSPISFPKKEPEKILGLEVKGLGEHGLANCTGSIHKNGQPWRIIGTKKRTTYRHHKTAGSQANTRH
jgi:Bifunctional DNA primase/polymerase, N-terminal